MKTLILYASNTGTVKDCALKLNEMIPQSEAVDITKALPDPNGYDRVILGASIRAGRINKKIAEYAENTLPILLTKETGLFICCADASKVNGYFVEYFPGELIMKAKKCACFGGELNIKNARGLDKLMLKLMKKMSGGSLEGLKIDTDAIRSFAALFGGK